MQGFSRGGAGGQLTPLQVLLPPPPPPPLPGSKDINDKNKLCYIAEDPLYIRT